MSGLLDELDPLQPEDIAAAIHLHRYPAREGVSINEMIIRPTQQGN